jgi:glycosyltransferase involved in cell wall biosynthesis
MNGGASGLKVCHVFAGTEGGRWVYEQLEILKRQHGAQTWAVLGGDSGTTVELCRAAGIPVKAADFSVRGWKSLFSAPWRILKLAWWMRRQRFDVVQSHVMQSTLIARPAAWLADVPVRLVMVTGPFFMQAPATCWIEMATVWMETGVIPSCNLSARLYREAGIAETLLQPTLYYGPDAEAWDPARVRPAGIREEFGLTPDAPLIGMVAVFYPRCAANRFYPPETHDRFLKGHQEMIRAMHRVRAVHGEAKLLLIGKGWGTGGEEAEAELRALVRDEGLDDAVIFTGYRSDVASVYLDLDVSVQASLNDNLGGTVESLLMECPTVATRVGGLVDSVVDSETGLLVAPGDPDDLARGILRLLGDRREARQLGERGRARMLAGFTLEKTAAGLVEIYSRQRRSARGAWRLRVAAWRLVLAGLFHAPVLGRALMWELYLRRLAPARRRSFVDRLRLFGLRLAGRPPKAALRR